MKQSVAQRLQELYDKHGSLTPDMVLEDARKKTSPLHGEFEWDTEKAAHRHWIDRARHLIRSVKIEVKTTRYEVKVPRYIKDPAIDRHKQGYTDVTKLRTEHDQARDAIINEFSRARACLDRARRLAIGLEVKEELDSLISDIDTLTGRVRGSEAAVA